jgi:hypothetical protein
MFDFVHEPTHRAVAAIALIGFAVAGCAGDEGTGLSVTVLDGQTKQPVPGALVAIEEGGIYLPNPDLTQGNPSYKLGAQADGEGIVALPFESGDFGLHVFADGYRYGPRRVILEGPDSMTIELAPELPEDVDPVIGEVTLDPATVAPGGSVVVRAAVAAGMVSDPVFAPVAKISEEVLLIAPALGIGFALDPPAPGCSIGEDPAVPRGCPDGEYTSTFAAPSAPGEYSYHFVVSSEGCVTSDRIELTLVVE